MRSQRKIITLAVLLVAVAGVWWLKQVQRESDWIDFVSQYDLTAPTVVSEEPSPDSWDIDQFKAFFIEYRLQRERVRDKEMEMLNQMIENPNISAEGKRQAEEQLILLIEKMEKELLVENMVKAQGYKDAIFFFQQGLANVVIQSDKLSDQECLQIAEMISGVTGVRMEDVTVVEHQEQ